MSWKQLAGKGTWLGTATAAVVLLAALGVSSLLLLRGIVPERAMGPLVWGSSVLACICGGRMAIRQGGDGPLPRALAVSACVYGAMWIAALTGNEAIHFTGSGIAQTCAVWGGGLLAGLIGTKQKRRRPRSGGRQGSRSPHHAFQDMVQVFSALPRILGFRHFYKPRQYPGIPCLHN